MRLKNWLLASGCGLASISPTFATQTTFLYQGSGNTPPGLPAIVAVTTGAVASSSAGATTLDTTSDYNLKDGYSSSQLFYSSFPTLNPATGFSVGLDVQINSESHTIGTTVNSNRAGFDLIVLGSDDKGVELGFWGDDIWAQNFDFTHGEDATFNTELTSEHYDLSILGSTYTLSADGTPILTGSTRDDSAEGAPYTLPNFVFIGDDTTEAEASETFSTLSVTVPEPATLGTLVLAAGVLARRRRR